MGGVSLVKVCLLGDDGDCNCHDHCVSMGSASLVKVCLLEDEGDAHCHDRCVS